MSRKPTFRIEPPAGFPELTPVSEHLVEVVVPENSVRIFGGLVDVGPGRDCRYLADAPDGPAGPQGLDLASIPDSTGFVTIPPTISELCEKARKLSAEFESAFREAAVAMNALDDDALQYLIDVRIGVVKLEMFAMAREQALELKRRRAAAREVSNGDH